MFTIYVINSILTFNLLSMIEMICTFSKLSDPP